ncbi:zinc finger CW-type PWWP domain protein 1 isoform X4 [Eubalaena glacialis]|uniref:zinc finger CW-type PWWP domain protein 1 isoform X4 n=1 Tax=Eubalaena glacialis TaxID=27606 RepID=UPI002A5A0463|nr:zinc finger CW-type PWWP domain protein 1 isoform X4 [Eubalaena glacialis]
MMTTLQSKDECGKGPKKTFAPPAQKLHSLMPCNLNSSKEDILGISSPEAETRPSLLKARLEKKKEKTTKENGTGSGQEIKGKAQDNKKAEKKEKSKYHVTFFGETVSRAWIPVNMLKNFQELSLELAGKKCRSKDCSQELGAALMMAQEAEQISIQERVNLFGFWSRYSGSDNSGEGKDVMLSGANSLDSCLEKEEEESELEEEEEEQQKKALRKNLKLPKARPQ